MPEVIFIEHLFTVNCIEKTKIKKKEAGNGPFKKKESKNNSNIGYKGSLGNDFRYQGIVKDVTNFAKGTAHLPSIMMFIPN